MSIKTTTLICTLVYLVSNAVAQQNTFQWGPALTSSSLRECGQVKLQVSAAAGNALSPPFYMFAYEPGGVTTSSFLGNDPNNLQWTVDHAAGARVVLQVADSKGNSGGVSPSTYPVNTGTSSSCHSSSSSPLALTTSSTQLSTCDKFVLDISGGRKPYTIMLAAVNSNVVTNATMGAKDNEYTYINRAPPGSSLLAVAIDATGTFSTTTKLLPLSGTSDTSCNGAQSSSGVKSGTSASSDGISPSGPQTQTASSETPSSTAGDSQSSNKTSHAGAIAGGLIGALAAVGLAIAFVFYRRRAMAKRMQNSKTLDAWSRKKGWDTYSPNVVTPFTGGLDHGSGARDKQESYFPTQNPSHQSGGSSYPFAPQFSHSNADHHVGHEAAMQLEQPRSVAAHNYGHDFAPQTSPLTPHSPYQDGQTPSPSNDSFTQRHHGEPDVSYEGPRITITSPLPSSSASPAVNPSPVKSQLGPKVKKSRKYSFDDDDTELAYRNSWASAGESERGRHEQAARDYARS